MPRGSQVRIPYDWMKITRQSARVLERVGAVTADGRALVAGAAVDAGTIVETGADGSVTLELVDCSVLVLKPSSRLRLERLQRIDGAGADEALLQLDRGKLETEVKPRSDMGRFEIRTPAAVSAVRGTGFRASFAGASRSATTETLEGAVAYRHQLARGTHAMAAAGRAACGAGGAAGDGCAVAHRPRDPRCRDARRAGPRPRRDRRDRRRQRREVRPLAVAIALSAALLAGLRPIDIFAVELNCIDLGQERGSIGPVGHSVDSKAYAAFVVGYLPLPLVDLYAKAGVARKRHIAHQVADLKQLNF
jgi:hypothetical protein